MDLDLDLSFIREQPRYVLYGALLILLGFVLVIVGLLTL